MSHEVTIRTDSGFILECSCGQRLMYYLDEAVPYAKVSGEIIAHMEPEMDTALKEALRGISVADIVKAILRIRKP